MVKVLKSLCLVFLCSLPLLAQLQTRVSIAVNDLSGKGLDQSTAEICSDRLRNELVKTGVFRVMERGEMLTILKEQGFQQSGACDDKACIVEAGRLLGVERIIAGSIGKVENFYTISLRIIEIKTAEIISVVDEDFTGTAQDLISRVIVKTALKLADLTDKTGTIKAQNQIALATANSVIDAEGNIYQTIIIGKQVWTSENLRTTKYNEGTEIPHVSDEKEWNKITTGAYCFYNNSTSKTEQRKWGALYNWYTINSQKLAPEGWRIATNEDWKQLENYLIANNYNYDGTTNTNKIAKALATKTDWNNSENPGTIGNNLTGNNTSSFNALPGGYRSYSGKYASRNNEGFWWSSSESDYVNAYYRGITYKDRALNTREGNKNFGFSVRLVKNNQ